MFINQDTSSEIMVHDEPIDYMLETSEDSVAALLSDTTDEEHEIITNNDNLKYIPLATKTTYGVIKVGDGLRVVNGVLNVIGGGGSGGSDVTKLSELENDVGFITNSTDKLINYYSKTETDNKLLVLDETIQTVQSAKADKSELNGLITNAVDDLVNYYKKSESYNKDEVNELVSKIPKFGIAVVDDLTEIPDNELSDTTIYLVPKTDIANGDYYDEYLWLNGIWERFGSVKVNLNDYYTKTESAAKFVDFDSIQNVSGRKNFKNISFEKLLLNNDVLINVGSDRVHYGAEGYSLSFTSKERPYIYVGDNLTLKSLAYTSDIPNVPTSTSQLTNDSGFITQTILDNNYYTAGETAQLIEDVGNSIPTHLSQLQTDTNNQRVSATEKATWNNKSNFSGNYNDLTNKPNMSDYLTSSSASNITARKTFINKALEIAPTAGAQPTYIYSTGDAFKVDGISQFIELDDSKSSPIIRLLGYDIATKDDLKDIGVDTSNLVTTDTEQTISAKKTISNLAQILNQDGQNILNQTDSIIQINNILKELWLYSNGRVKVNTNNEVAYLSDIPTLKTYNDGTSGYYQASVSIGGLTIKFGNNHLTPTANAVKQYSITFNTPFTSHCVGVVCGSSTASTLRTTNLASEATLTGLTVAVYRTNDTNTNFSWIAVGI